MGLSICSMAWVNHENGKNVPLILAVLFKCGNIMVWWKSSSITGLMSLALLVVSFLNPPYCKRALG